MTGDTSVLDQMSDDCYDSADEEAENTLGQQRVVKKSPWGQSWQRAVAAKVEITDDFIMTLQLRDPRSLAELMFLNQLMELERSKSLAHYLGRFKLRSQKASSSSRTPAMCRICERWSRQAWLTVLAKNEEQRTVCSTVGRQRIAKGPIPEIETARIAHNIGLTPTEETLRTLGNVMSPNEAAHPAVWQSYYANYVNPLEAAYGLRRQPDTPIDERLLRTMLRFRGMFSTQSRPGMLDTIGTRVRILGYSILAIPGCYRALLESSRTSIADGPNFRFQSFEANSALESNVARLMASNGVTFAEANDAWEFANQWLEDILHNSRLQIELRNLVRYAIELMRTTSPPVGGGLPDHIPIVWDPTIGRWRPDPQVIATANAALEAHIALTGSTLLTVAGAGATAPETNSTTAPGGTVTVPPSEDTTMSSQPPPPGSDLPNSSTSESVNNTAMEES
jgi:hypothetical protein